MRTALFWVITQRIVVIFYRRFGTTYRYHLQGSTIPLPPPKKVRSSHLLSDRSLKSHLGGFVVLPSCCSCNRNHNPCQSAPMIYEGKHVAKPRYLSTKVVHEIQTRIHRHVRRASEPVWALWWREQYPSGPCVETLLIPQLLTCWLNPLLLLWNFNMRNKSESTGFWKCCFSYRVYEQSIHLVLVLWWRRLKLNNFRCRNKDGQSNF